MAKVCLVPARDKEESLNSRQGCTSPFSFPAQNEQKANQHPLDGSLHSFTLSFCNPN